MTHRDNYYSILGIPTTASHLEIKRAYRALVKRYHPDKNLGNNSVEEHFKTIQEAYYVLSDTGRRKNYDLKFSAHTDTNQRRKHAAYNGNAYQYAQQMRQQKRYSSPPASGPSSPINHYKTEKKQLVISIIVALLFLYFIMSY